MTPGFNKTNIKQSVIRKKQGRSIDTTYENDSGSFELYKTKGCEGQFMALSMIS